jgi:hypothetical protein
MWRSAARYIESIHRNDIIRVHAQARINADGSRVVIVLRPASVTGRQQVR